MCPILRTIDIYEVYVMNTRRIYACIVSVLDLLFIVPKNMSCEFIETVDDKSIPYLNSPIFEVNIVKRKASLSVQYNPLYFFTVFVLP